MSLRTLYPLALLGLVAAGCGGGGGSKPSRGTGVVSLFAELTNADPGAKLRYTLVRFDGSEDGALVADRTVAATNAAQVDLGGLPAGTLHLKGALTAANGTFLGSVDTLVDGSTASAFTITQSGTPTEVSVLPSALLMRPGENRRLLATAKTNDGRLVLLPPNGVRWSVGSASVVEPQDGAEASVRQIAGVGEGTTSVVATVGAVSPVSVPATVVSPAAKKWTVLVYMNAANDLAPFSRTNMDQIERIADNPNVRFVVQWKTLNRFDSLAPFQGTRRYLARRDDAGGVGSTLLQDMGDTVDMGRPQTLSEFVAWGRSYFPSERTILVIWNHGNGWRRNATGQSRSVSGDDERNTEIQTWELPGALGNARFDAIVWDASLMQMFEVAYDLRNHANYILGSQESPPGVGLPYDAGFAGFRDTPDAPTLDLLKPLVDVMVASPEFQNSKVTESILDCSKLEALATAVDGLGQAMIQNQPGLTALVPAVRNQAQAYSPTFGRVYRDLYDVADRLGAGSSLLTSTAETVKAAVSAAVVYEGHTPPSGNSHGLSIDFSSASQFSAVANDYAQTGLAARTRWDDWLSIAP